MNERHLRIMGSGSYAPKREISSSELDKIVGVGDGTCFKTTRVKRRFWVEDETASEMGKYASEMAISDAGVSKKDLDLIISANGVNEQPVPTGSCLLSYQLGLGDSSIPCFDVGSSCLSFIEALDVASYMLQSPGYNLVLVCSSDITSGGTDLKDLKSAPLLGDGAGAVVLSSDKRSRLLCSNIETYSKFKCLSEIVGGGNKIHPLIMSDSNRDSFRYRLDGKEMAKVVFGKLEGFMDRTFKKANLDWREELKRTKLAIPHQVSPSFVRICKHILDLPHGIDLTQDYGNMFAASVPFALDYGIRNSGIKRGERLLMAGGGSGISLGAMYLEY